MESEIIENLVDFALENYGIFNFFPRDQVRAFFEIRKNTTAIFSKDGKIRCFLVWEYRGANLAEVVAVAATGSRLENILFFWDLWERSKELLPDLKIYWRTENGRLRELKCHG